MTVEYKFDCLAEMFVRYDTALVQIYNYTNCALISTYHHWSCAFKSCSWCGVLDTTLCDKVHQWLVAGWWFSFGTPVSYTNKTDHNNITEILLNHPNPNPLMLCAQQRSSIFEDAKRVIRSCKLKDRQYNGQKKKDRQWSIKHYTEN